MHKGIIKNLCKGYGFIQPDYGGQDVFFHFSILKGVKIKEIDRVEFEVEQDKYGRLRARNLKVLGADQETAAASEQTDCYRFLNPYNFVRTIQKGREKGRILGDCPPPPHDRYVGLTGRITCELEAVTPLFISDSHAVKKDDNGHKTYRFFQYDGQPALPASSLRGMVRSVFESLTNSCFVVYQKDTCSDGKREICYPLEYRATKVKDLIPARVVDIRKNGSACLEKLDCTINPPVKISETCPDIIRAGLVKESYPPRVKKNNGTIFNPSRSILTPDFYDGMRVCALVQKDLVEHRKNKIHYYAFHVMTIEPVEEGRPVSLRRDENHELVYGWLHLTGPNIENKHDERLFFRWDDKKPEPSQLNEIPTKHLCHCDRSVIEEYNHHLNGYWDRLGARVKKLGDKRWPNGNTDLPQPSMFVEKDRKLQVGDLVYVKLGTGGRGVMLRPVAMPRIPYRHCREDFLPEHLKKRCNCYDALCPACRIFGWVHENAENIGVVQTTAYTGRVKFSHGKVIGKPIIEEEKIRLAILSTPKPTTTPFYLLDSEGKPNVYVTYDNDNARLRGRKMYRHHEKVNPGEYKGKVENEQNRTIVDAIKPELKFMFWIDFENLAPLELGALLYALELEDGMFHRLGLAKPLGFGSVKVKVTEVKTINWATRLSSIGKEAGWELFDNNQQTKQTFMEEMRNLYDTEFDNVLNDLRCLLGAPPDDMPIHYPRPSTPLDQDKHPQYEWFVGNNKRCNDACRPKEKRKLPEPVALALASEEKDGLPLINRNGEEGY